MSIDDDRDALLTEAIRLFTPGALSGPRETTEWEERRIAWLRSAADYMEREMLARRVAQ